MNTFFVFSVFTNLEKQCCAVSLVKLRYKQIETKISSDHCLKQFANQSCQVFFKKLHPSAQLGIWYSKIWAKIFLDIYFGFPRYRKLLCINPPKLHLFYLVVSVLWIQQLCLHVNVWLDLYNSMYMQICQYLFFCFQQ